MWDESRLQRLRSDELAGLVDRRRAGGPSHGAPRFVGRIVNGGAFPGSPTPGRYYLVEPLRIGGSEAEASTASTTADATRRTPVLILGSRTPAIGDQVVALAVGGRWVAELAQPNDGVACNACTLPRSNLTLTCVNTLFGTASVPLVWDGVGAWSPAACVNGLRFRLSCDAGVATFAATYYTSGVCPTGTPISCVSPGSNPLALTLTVQTCSPLLLRFTVTSASCPSLSLQGYTRFEVTL